MLSIAIDLTYGNSYTFRWGAPKRDTAGQLGFAHFFFPPSQNFTFQGDRVTVHSVLKRFYSRECHKYSLLRMWLDYLIPFFFFFPEAKLGRCESDGFKNPFSNKEPDDIPSVAWIPDLSLDTRGGCACGRDFISWPRAGSCQPRISSKPFAFFLSTKVPEMVKCLSST